MTKIYLFFKSDDQGAYFQNENGSYAGRTTRYVKPQGLKASIRLGPDPRQLEQLST